MQYTDQVAAKKMILRCSDYFQPKEFACPCCGLTLMDDELIIALDHLRSIFKRPLLIVPGGGYRCQIHNRRENGAPRSRHLLGQAVDIRVRDMPSRDILRLLELVNQDYSKNPDGTETGIARFQGIGLGLATGTKRFHIDIREEPALWTY